MGIHWLLYSSCYFLNTNTAITRQLIRSARTLGAEWWQVCGEACVRGQRKMSQVLDAFGLLDFTMLRPVLAWRAFWKLWAVYFFNLPNFLGGPRQTSDTGVRLSWRCMLDDGRGPKDDYFGKLDRNVKTGVKQVLKGCVRVWGGFTLQFWEIQIWEVFKERVQYEIGVGSIWLSDCYLCKNIYHVTIKHLLSGISVEVVAGYRNIPNKAIFRISECYA